MKRFIVGLLGAILVVLGGALGAASAWAYTAFDSDGVMRFDVGTITPANDAAATLIDIDRFAASVPYLERYGTTRLAFERADGGALFVGAGPTDRIDTLVAGSPYSVALRDGTTWTARTIPGSLIPPAPEPQTFWLAADSGPAPSITVPDVRPLTVVLMDPTAAATGPIDVFIDFAFPAARSWALGLAIAGGVLIVVGIAVLVIAVRMRSRRGRHARGPDDPPPAAAAAEVASDVTEVTSEEAAPDPVPAPDDAFPPEPAPEPAPEPEPEPEPESRPAPDASDADTDADTGSDAGQDVPVGETTMEMPAIAPDDVTPDDIAPDDVTPDEGTRPDGG